MKFSKRNYNPNQPTQNNKPTRKTTNGKKLITQKTNNPTNQQTQNPNEMLKFSKEKLQPQPTQNKKQPRKTTDWKNYKLKKTDNPTNQLKTQLKCWNFPKKNYNLNQHKTTNQLERQLTGKNL